MPAHIFTEYDTALRAFRELILAMAAQARQNLENAMCALMTRDTELAAGVLAADNDVDELERKVDHHGMELLLRFHPVASDLRSVIAGMKISTNLERISDHAVNIAKRARKLNRVSPRPEAQQLEPLYSAAYGILRDAMDAYTRHDPALGSVLAEKDREVDRLHKALIKEFGARMDEREVEAEVWLHLIFVCRSLERVADLAVNIGEEAVFLESAKDIRHEQRRNGGSPPPPQP
jgi:phosphate transport system protein